MSNPQIPKMRILILCTGNSCRSQMAEGFLKEFDNKMEVFSAGTKPSHEVHPKAVEVMNELGIDLSDHVPENVDQYLGQPFDYVITVCGSAKETCPTFMGEVKHHLHIGFEDPADATGSNEEVLAEFRSIRDQIKRDFSLFYKENIV